MATQTDPFRPQGLIAAGAASKTPVAGFTAATADPTKATSTGYNPAQVQVRDFETTQGQLDKVLAKDSPLMQQAARRANQATNSRGLLNSSLAVGAAQDAVIQNALPIAQQDAQTLYDANVRSVDALNAARGFQAQAGNQASLANAQLGTETSRANAQMANEAAARTADAANTADLAKLDAGTRMQLGQLDATTRKELGQLDATTRTQLAQMDNQTRTNLTTIENNYRQLLQANQNAANMYQQAVNAIANISIQNTLSRETKDAAIASQLNILNEGLRATQEVTQTRQEAVAGLNLGQFFQDFNIPNSQFGIGNVSFN